MQVIAEIWPFNRVLWAPVARFLFGHGFDSLTNVFYDLFYWPIIIWNTCTNILFWPINTMLDIVNFLPNMLLAIPEILFFLIPDIFLYAKKIIKLIFLGIPIHMFSIPLILIVTALSNWMWFGGLGPIWLGSLFVILMIAMQYRNINIIILDWL